ncbi:sulfite exporter TauE/SafE family protein [Sphingomonas sp. GlSt437]|uniref:sulfite exporter TauE/SafE family protein n=1 Tax=Sphingomonas sp. GlSt437 TaxID=3389970 RepID=UPI003A88DD9E
MPLINPMYSLAGVLVGLLVGLTGVGGGSLMTPLLVLFFGFHPTTAVGTDLLYASATKTVGTSVHGWRGTVSWRVVGLLALGSVPMTLATIALIGDYGQQSPAISHLITTVLGIILVLTALATFLRQRLIAWIAPRFARIEPHGVAILTVVLGMVLGVLVTLTSAGAGALGMTALILLYPQMPVNRLVGSDIAHAVPLTLLGGLGHLYLGTVNLDLLASLLVGSIPGIIIGSLLAARAPDRILGPLLATTLAVVGVKLLT